MVSFLYSSKLLQFHMIDVRPQRSNQTRQHLKALVTSNNGSLILLKQKHKERLIIFSPLTISDQYFLLTYYKLTYHGHLMSFIVIITFRSVLNLSNWLVQKYFIWCNSEEIWKLLRILLETVSYYSDCWHYSSW